MFCERYYINAQTSRDSLDILLSSKGLEKVKKSSTRTDGAGRKVKETTVYYNDLGLYFRKYEDNDSQFSLAVKLQDYIEKEDEKRFGLRGKLFTGQLFIGENYINDKKTLSSLRDMKNCKVKILELNTGTWKYIMGAQLIYGGNYLQLLFDNEIRELTGLIIHHNIKQND